MPTTAPAAAELRTIPLSLLFPSPTNPRGPIKPADVAELAASIKAQGLVHPLLVRPSKLHTGKFEIVAGHRRHQGAIAAGLAELPATVRELTDSQVMEIQIVENLQREGLTALEEGRGYRQLLDLPPGKDGKKLTAEDIAQRVGKSRRYIYNKMKLLDLCDDAQKALAKGELSESVAILLARISEKDQQAKVLPTLLDGEYGDGPMTVDDAEFLLRREMPDLIRAPFDIKVSVFGVAGSCMECTQRAGNMPDQFPDPESGHLCTNRACYLDKCKRTVSEAMSKALTLGQQAIQGPEAKKLAPNGTVGPLKGGLALLESHAFAGLSYADAIKRLPKDIKVRITVVEDVTRPGHTFEAVDINAATQAFLKAGLKRADEPAATPSRGITPLIRRMETAVSQPDLLHTPEELAAMEKARKAEYAKQEAIDQHLFDQVTHENAGLLSDGMLRELIIQNSDFYDDAAWRCARKWSGQALANEEAADYFEQAVGASLLSQSRATLNAMLCDLLIAQSISVQSDTNDPLNRLVPSLCDQLGLNMDDIRKQALKPATAKREQPANKAAAKKAPKPAPKSKKPAPTAKSKPAPKTAKAKPKTSAKAKPAPKSKTKPAAKKTSGKAKK